ncbi:MAG: TraB/GumN family protein [Bacteroidia bacterium]|nr:TraB/GumN family protein [Bacteroidia bacterium]
MLLVLAVNFSSFSQAQKYQGLLWEISGNGLAKPSYLYGTMHVSKKLAFHLSDAFFDGLNTVDVVALETNPETWLENMMKIGLSSLNSKSLKNYFKFNSQNFYEDAFEINIPNNKFIKTQLSVEPENINGLLYRYSGYTGNFEEYTYLDLFIFQTAKKTKKVVTALEDFDTSVEMVTKASLPDNDKTTKKDFQKYISPYLLNEQIEDCYRKGDLDGLDSLHKLMNRSENFQKYMLIDRNIIMANNMDSIMKKQTLFTAIGAAHLPGEQGVISLLRKMGYTVTPVRSSVSKKSTNTMAQYEKKHTSLVYTTQYATDSSFKIDAPGKLFDIRGFGETDAYMYTDMTNGSYYLIKKINLFGKLTGLDAEHQYNRLDSLLYENIPGKIVSKKHIKSNNGMKGVDILNKTRRGDFQRYQIFVSSDHLYIFKVGGGDEYVKSQEVQHFFKSITFIEKPTLSTWKTFSPSYGGYQIAIPSNYSFDKPKDYDFQLERIIGSVGDDYYLFNRSILNDYNYIEEDTFELGQLAIEYAKKLNYQIESKRTTFENSCPTLYAKSKNIKGFYLHFKIVIKNAQYFLLACKSASEKEPEDYFNSFKFKDVVYEPFKNYTDSTFHFTVMTDYNDKEKSYIDDLLKKMMNYSKQKEKDRPYQSKSMSKDFTSANTGEVINVEFFKCNDYRMDESLDAFWEKQIDHFLAYSTLSVQKKKAYVQNELPMFDLVLTDTNSVRAIKIKMILKQGVLYSVNSLVDTISPPTKWNTTFYETFMPDDTVIGKNIFVNKVDEFFSDAISSDSLIKEKVNSLYTEIKFKNDDAPKIMKFIAGKNFNNLSLNVKSSLFRSLGMLSNKEITAFLKKEYVKYKDSSSIQLSILNALASQKNNNSSMSFLECIKMETPLSSSEYEVEDVFYPFYDSLSVAGPLFPSLFDITKYPEYRSSVYHLASRMLDSLKINSSVYLPIKKDLLREANDELKRQIASEESFQSNTQSFDNYVDYENMSPEAAAAKLAEQLAAMNYSNYENTGESSYLNYLLVDYCNLLSPFYSDPSVKSFFDKAMKTKDDKFKIELVSIYLKQNIPVPDTIIRNLAKNIETRLMLLNRLKEIKQIDKVGHEYKDQKAVTYAMLYAGETEEEKSDSIKFIGSRYVENKYEKGLVYFYTSKLKGGEKTYLDYVAIQPADTNKVIYNCDYINRRVNSYDDEQKTIDEKINEICYELTLKGRRRVNNKGNYGGFNYLDNYYQD